MYVLIIKNNTGDENFERKIFNTLSEVAEYLNQFKNIFILTDEELILNHKKKATLYNKQIKRIDLFEIFELLILKHKRDINFEYWVELILDIQTDYESELCKQTHKDKYKKLFNMISKSKKLLKKIELINNGK